jgi:phosphatidylglycerol:prolipoprotein diacylglycerol transferase
LHPDIWTVPGTDFSIRAYGLFIGIGIVVALVLAIRRARRGDLDPATVTTMSLIGLVMGIIGCRVMHFVHHFSKEISRGEVGVRQIVTAVGGGEILGGVVLATISAVAYLAIRRKPVLCYLDAVFPPMVLAMGIGRVGCLMFGCCWGGVCVTEAGDKSVPWAVRFPYGSPAYLRQAKEDRLTVPDSLVWISPFTKEHEPIPREVFAKIDIDGDEVLAGWAAKAAAYRAAKSDAPESEETARLAKEERAAREALAGRRHIELEVAAAAHLQNLAGRTNGEKPSWADLRELAARQLSLWVHPTQVYDAVALVLLYVVLTAIPQRGKAPGTVVAWAMILYPVNRFVQEMIRGDNPRDVFGLTISQFMCIVIVIMGVALAVVLARRPVLMPEGDSSSSLEPRADRATGR